MSNPNPNTFDVVLVQGHVMIQRAVPLLDVPDMERRVIAFLANNRQRWENQENTPLSVGLALEMDTSERMVRRGLRELHRKDWIIISKTTKSRQYAQTTQQLVDLCAELVEQQQIRRWVGSTVWARLIKHYDTEDLCKMLSKEAEATEGSRYSRNVYKASQRLDAELRQRTKVVPIHRRVHIEATKSRRVIATDIATTTPEGDDTIMVKP